MEIHGIDHVQITIPPNAEDEARAFYCGVLGLSEIDKPASLQQRGGLWLQVGERQLHLGIADSDRTSRREHIAYAVFGLDAWRAHLLAHGIASKQSLPIPNYDRFEFRDPFGNRVELIEYTG